jgi:hypothetical protein
MKTSPWLAGWCPRALWLCPLVCAATSSFAEVSPAAAAEPKPNVVWLVIAASDASPSTIAGRAKALALPGQIVVQMRDCGVQSNVFALVATVADSVEAGRAVLPSVQARVSDAYLKRCALVPRSLLALRVSAIDPSIGNVPADAVNWEDVDRVSSSVTLPDGRAMAVVRFFANEPDDPLEGKRQRVLLFQSGQQIVLEGDCPSASAFTARSGYVAFQCSRERAADEELHGTLVFDPSARKLGEVAHCRSPSWVPEGIACEAESVDAEGRLKLRRKTTSFESLKRDGSTTQP